MSYKPIKSPYYIGSLFISIKTATSATYFTQNPYKEPQSYSHLLSLQRVSGVTCPELH